MKAVRRISLTAFFGALRRGTECHLQLAHLYELAGAKQMATREYKMFLIKVPNHPDKKKFEKYIKDNPE